MTAVAGALQVAHTAGVVHRDVKPGNVFLTTAGEVKVLDFGIAWSAHDAALTTGGLLGTAACLAPERVLGTAPPQPPTSTPSASSSTSS